MDDALETKGIIYPNVETWFLFAPLSKFLTTRLTPSVHVYLLISSIKLPHFHRNKGGQLTTVTYLSVFIYT